MPGRPFSGHREARPYCEYYVPENHIQRPGSDFLRPGCDRGVLGNRRKCPSYSRMSPEGDRWCPDEIDRMVEAAGIEPASRMPASMASTHIVVLLVFAAATPNDRIHCCYPSLSGFAAFPGVPKERAFPGKPVFLSPRFSPQAGPKATRRHF